MSKYYEKSAVKTDGYLLPDLQGRMMGFLAIVII
jgi:hypothetical protein